MIESISISNTATYGNNPELMNELSKINFIFGANGTGKTTISRIIADESKFPSCKINWRGGKKMKTMVYNSDFIERNIIQSSELPGVFTLGEKQVETLKKIKETKNTIDNLNRKIDSYLHTLQGPDRNSGLLAELGILSKEFQGKCWHIKKKYDSIFKDAFEGVRSSSQRFSEKVLYEYFNNEDQLLPFDELKKKAEIVFTPAPQTEPLIANIDANSLLQHESNPILTKHVIGKEDIDIADMIKKLGNSDWVNTGRRYYEINNRICPFCQQITDESFTKSLSDYFDETYIKDCQDIDNLLSKYQIDVNNIDQKLNDILAKPSRFLDINGMINERENFKSLVQLNLERLKEKKKEPSQVTKLETLVDVISSIENLIVEANAKIQAHNNMVSNLSNEKKVLTSHIWRFIVDELKVDIESFLKRKEAIQKAITAIQTKIKTTNEEKTKKETELRALEKRTTSVKPTIDSINEVLSKFGFTNFRLEMSNSETSYKIIRSDGSDAKTTLSEGEKSFISFLYFYHLLKGSNSNNEVVDDRIVVFDDPVSSLDCDILFIVSSLIKGLFDDVINQTGYIKQLFILTHNVYFHKEITFNKDRRYKALKYETFWVVRKPGNESRLEKYTSNPITTSYDLLWAEVRNRNYSSLTIQNTLRRILENYFKIFGGIDPDYICDKFTGKDKLICKSLFSWVNDGSHYATDDLYISIEDLQIDNYLRIFREIFEKMGHQAHYKMMMGDAYVEDDDIVKSSEEAAVSM